MIYTNIIYYYVLYVIYNFWLMITFKYQIIICYMCIFCTIYITGIIINCFEFRYNDYFNVTIGYITQRIVGHQWIRRSGTKFTHEIR